jgi:hypothetical protein
MKRACVRASFSGFLTAKDFQYRVHKFKKMRWKVYMYKGNDENKVSLAKSRNEYMGKWKEWNIELWAAAKHT